MKMQLLTKNGTLTTVNAPKVTLDTKVVDVDFALNVKYEKGQWYQQVSCGWLLISGPGDIHEDPCLSEDAA